MPKYDDSAPTPRPTQEQMADLVAEDIAGTVRPEDVAKALIEWAIWYTEDYPAERALIKAQMAESDAG